MALVFQNFFIVFGLVLTSSGLPYESKVENSNLVSAFSILPLNKIKPKQYGLTVGTEVLNCSPCANDLVSTSCTQQSCTKKTLCKKPPKTRRELGKSLCNKSLTLPIHRGFLSTMSIPTLAKAALATYDPEHTLKNENYKLCNYLDFDGFRAATFCNHKNKIAILAFRGTQNTKDAAFDLALLYGQEGVMSSFAKLFSRFANIQDSFLESITGIGNRATSAINDAHSHKVKKAHKAYLEELTRRWQNYRNKHLSSPGIAEKTLNKRVGYVTNYTLKQIKHFNNLGYEVYLTGHSLGGLYAQLASMMFGLPGATFNAPGVSDVLYHCKNFIPQVKKSVSFVNYRHNDDLVSLFKLDDHFGSVIAHEFPKKAPYTAHNMKIFFQLLSDVHFDEKGENDYKDLVAFIEDETDTISSNPQT